ncbi:FTR1 family iron permease [Dictyobacter kobayashii]|uniref:Iron permease n=1 Tax=Dictyobacter kobayashii TaxID=2014872 RepID=A0A402APZ8_9CHLR|nr:FTR1 family protein [Dictyobacter kobayashii]GCE21197.1 hypothetical protein KDK_49970 [Dictyobacter kobayashii]
MRKTLSSSIARPTLLAGRIVLILGAVVVAAILVWQGITANGNPDPAAAHITPEAAIVNTGILVFREGLECILVLMAITASMMGKNQGYRRPIAIGSAIGFGAVLLTWFAVVGILSALSNNLPALDIQAATGLLAIIVLLVIMNWFFHKIYWTGWISMHNKRKKELLSQKNEEGASQSRLMSGLILLGFASVYREGFEVVLFLQTLRLQVGSLIVLYGVLIGLALTAIVGSLTFVLHHRLPYKKMLVLTGVMLGVVLLVMVGEQAQEMQLAHWISTTPVNLPIPAWMGLWFAIFPTVETLVAQALAAILVIGSYFLARYQTVLLPRKKGEKPAERPEAPPTAVAEPSQASA